MVCNFCNAELNDEALFCPNCGQPTTGQNASNQTEASQETNTGKNNFISVQPLEIPTFTQEIPSSISQLRDTLNFDVISLIAGIFFVLVGFLRLLGSSTELTPLSFGADYYTYAYRGMVECAELISKLNGTVSWLIIAVGVLISIKALKSMQKK